MKHYIPDFIVAEVKEQPLGLLYALEADEVTNVSNWEQLAIVVRHLKGSQPVERLVQCIACESITGEQICQKMVESVKSLGLDPKDRTGPNL